jgi:hypothetical protein
VEELSVCCETNSHITELASMLQDPGVVLQRLEVMFKNYGSDNVDG